MLVTAGAFASVVGGILIINVLALVITGAAADKLGYTLPPDVSWPTQLLPQEILVGLIAITALGLFMQLLDGEREAPTHAIESIGGVAVANEEYPEIRGLVKKVCQQATTPEPSLYIVPTDTPLSLVTGYSAESARLALSEGLISLLDEDELEAVIAHEIAHVRNHDMAVMTAASLPIGATDRILKLLSGENPGVEHGQASRADVTDLCIAAGLVAIIPVWALAHILTASLSRSREYAADQGAVALTGKPASLASALTAIDQELNEMPATDLRQSEIAAAAILESETNTLGVRRYLPAPLKKLLNTHPDSKRRLTQLRELERKQET
ncbi:M48 family metalloprotease [Haloprofundus salilacus]|uniref:M48 family metalloprotease n=1 Tax=Haloprofundus salilacus TaxID=2876190 RepID=UPI001CCF7FFA|nr:M48 family metalloprotease [Haloprofundus salilacus]